jgi:hypothetical protein
VKVLTDVYRLSDVSIMARALACCSSTTRYLHILTRPLSPFPAGWLGWLDVDPGGLRLAASTMEGVRLRLWYLEHFFQAFRWHTLHHTRLAGGCLGLGTLAGRCDTDW